MYKKILIPTDGSAPAEAAIKEGIKLAKALGSKIYGLYVVDISAFAGIPAEAIWENMRSLLEEEGKKALERVEKLADTKDVKCKTIMKEGIPSKEIISTAEEIKAGLIVMGTSGKSGLNRFLLGSVTEKVVRTSKIPVLVIRG